MKITNEDNSRLISFYEEKLQKICKQEITEAYISYRGELCIKCSNTGRYYTVYLLGDILICSKTILKLLGSNNIYEITLGLNLL